MVPPDPMPNSEVKRRSADGSVGSPHVRVGNCQASNKMKGSVGRLGLLFLCFAARRAAIFPGGAALTGATNRSGLVARIRRQSPSGKDAGLHRQHVLEHHPGGDRRADHPGHVRPIACISRKFCPSASRPTLLDTRAAIGNADTPAEPISGLILCLLI